MVRLAAWIMAAALSGAAVPVYAQDPSPSVSFRVLDEERLFRGSVLGQRVLADIRAAEALLEVENQRLFEQLSAEERVLTEARATLPPDEFRAEAEAFDTRVEAIRAERAARSAEVSRQSEQLARGFFDAALPVLVEVMSELGAEILLKPDVLILGPDWLDITDQAIARLDASTPPATP